MAPDGHQRRRNHAGCLCPRQHRNAPYQDDTGRFYAIQRNIWTKREPCAGSIQPCDTIPAIQRRRPAIQTRRKVFSGWGSARGGGAVFTEKSSPAPSRSPTPSKTAHTGWEKRQEHPAGLGRTPPHGSGVLQTDNKRQGQAEARPWIRFEKKGCVEKTACPC